MAIVQNPLRVRLFINRGPVGWSEGWNILETDWTRALSIALQLAQARSRLMSSDCVLEWASLASLTPPYLEQPVITAALTPLPQWGPAILPQQGILFNFGTVSGAYTNRLFRAMDGTQIANKTWVTPNLLIPAAIPALPVNLATASKELLFQNTLSTFMNYTCFLEAMSLGHYGEGTGWWMMPWANCQYNQVSSWWVREKWQRMSWESANRNQCPEFSPCGTVTTVLRFSYTAPCRFGPDRPRQYIHYYYAKLGAAVCPFATPFYGWARAKENVDFTGPGELRKWNGKWWTNGTEYGNAPGVMWTGSAAQFAGTVPQSWPAGASTPSGLRPACDSVNFQRYCGPGGLGMGGPGCEWEPVPPSLPGSYWGGDYWGHGFWGSDYWP